MSIRITATDVDRVRARIALLEPIATACGVRYNDDDDALVNALAVIADHRRDLAEHEAAREERAADATATDHDLGSQVAERMLASRGRSTEQHNATHKAKAPALRALDKPALVTLGDQVAARMVARRHGACVPSWAK